MNFLLNIEPAIPAFGRQFAVLAETNKSKKWNTEQTNTSGESGSKNEKKKEDYNNNEIKKKKN